MLTYTETKTVLWFNLKNVYSNKEMHLINVIYLSSWLLAEKNLQSEPRYFNYSLFQCKMKRILLLCDKLAHSMKSELAEAKPCGFKDSCTRRHVSYHHVIAVILPPSRKKRRENDRGRQGERREKEKERWRENVKLSGLFLAIPPKMPVWEINLLSSLDRNLTLICLQPNPRSPCHSRFHSNLALSPCIYDTISSYFDYISVEIFKV